MHQIENVLIDQVAANKTPSVQYILFDEDSIIRRYSHGLADIAGLKEVNVHTTYNAFSVTKTFTALAILQLAEQEKLDIEQPISKYLPDFPYGPAITIRQLLTHSAGLPNPIPLSWIHLTSEHNSFDRNQFFKKVFIKNNRTKSKPNRKYSYSNLGYVLLGQLIEVVSGETYETYINKHIIKKLEVETHGLGFEIEDTGRHAKGYQKKRSFSNFILGFIIDKTKYMGEPEGNWKPFKNFYVNGSAHGGLIGTPDAFVKYIQALLKPNSVLIADNYKRLLFIENRTSDNKPTGMCLSWFTGQLNGHRYFAHAGGGGGYYCEIRIYPDVRMGSVVFFNRTGMSDERFLDKVDKIYFENNSNTFD